MAIRELIWKICIKITKYITVVFSQVDTACVSFFSKVFLDLCAHSVLVREGKLPVKGALGKQIMVSSADLR